MAQYLDKPGLDALWKKIKGMFVARTIQKSSDSNDVTRITHNGTFVSLSTGTMMYSSTTGDKIYTPQADIFIKGDDIIFTANHRPMYKTRSGEDPKNLVISSDIATPSTAGLVKSTTTGTTANRDYMVEVNPDGTMKVNVPWTDNNTTYSAGNGISLNGTTFSLNTNYENNGRNYAVLVDTNKNLYVNVPWVNTNTTYSAGTGLSLSGTTFSVKTGYSESGKNYAVKTDTNGNLYVNVPWTDTKTTVDSALSSTSTNPVQNKVIFIALNNKLNTSDFNAMKGVTNGLATLDSSGKVPSSQLPSYVDDVIEGYYYNSKFYKEESHTNEIAGESGKIYTDLGNNKTYRWSGTTYTEISASLALGETSSTAYPGDKGKANANNITTLKGYFTNGVAKQAAADGDGNNIVDTYATKQNLDSVAQNASAKIDKSVLTAKGDIIYASKANTPAKLAIGANGKVLKVVNGIPAWSDDNNTTYSAGTGLSLSGTTFNVNTGYTTNGKNYAVKTDTNKNLYVNVPWTDTNTTYSAGTGLSLSGTTFSLNTNYVATQSANGLMSAEDKTKLDNIEAIPISTIENLS